MKKILIILSVMQLRAVPELLVQDRQCNLSFIAQYFNSHKDKSIQVNAQSDTKFISKIAKKLYDTFDNNEERDVEMIMYNVKMVAYHVFYNNKHDFCNIPANKTEQITQFDKETRGLLCKIRNEAIKIQNYMYCFRDFYIDSNTGGEILLLIKKLMQSAYNRKLHKKYLISDELIVNNAINSRGFLGINRCFYIDINHDVFHNAICMLHSIEKMFIHSRSRFARNSQEVQVDFSHRLGSSKCIDMTEQAIEDHHEIWLKRLCLYKRISKKISMNIGSDLFDVVLSFMPRDKVFSKLHISNNLFNYQLLDAMFKSKNEEESQLRLYLTNVYDHKCISKNNVNK